MAERVQARPEQAQRGDGAMMEVARAAERVHRQAMPEAEPLRPDPFVKPTMRGLWIGAVLGAVIGLVWGALLRQHIIAVPGWEMLYSMYDATFITFWALMGVALGGAVGGVASLLATPMRGHE